MHPFFWSKNDWMPFKKKKTQQTEPKKYQNPKKVIMIWNCKFFEQKKYSKLVGTDIQK